MAEDTSLSKADFGRAWRDQREDTSLRASEVAWRRYQHIQAIDYQTALESEEPSLQQLEAIFTPMLGISTVSSLISSHKFVSIPSSTLPWKPTSLYIKAGQLVSTFATGRLWRSRLVDIFLPPQFGLYFRVGVNGRVFNSARDTNTFQAPTDGELYLAPQFPGQFGNPEGGRVQAALKTYDQAIHNGAYQIFVILWKEGTTNNQVINAFSGVLNEHRNSEYHEMVKSEIDRLTHDHATHKSPPGWQNLWFLGANEIYTQETFDGHAGIRCRPHRNVGILQKHFDPAVPFGPGFHVSWDWCITALPSRLREDTTISHDYLSVAFEFENGRDLTYTWSWELAKEHGYWCPVPTWEDREYHVVIRSGTDELGMWLGEQRDLFADYIKYIGRMNLPSQVTRVWLIAGNRWQRYEGEMLVRKIKMGDVEVL